MMIEIQNPTVRHRVNNKFARIDISGDRDPNQIPGGKDIPFPSKYGSSKNLKREKLKFLYNVIKKGEWIDTESNIFRDINLLSKVTINYRGDKYVFLYASTAQGPGVIRLSSFHRHYYLI